jgi:hypothetical protein
MNNDNWELIPTEDINQILKVRIHHDKAIEKDFSQLLMIKHTYTTSDDVLFPEVSTLGYLNSLEQLCLFPLHEKHELYYGACDISKGQIVLYIFTKDAQQTMKKTIMTLEKMPLFKVDFEIQSSGGWDLFESLKSFN